MFFFLSAGRVTLLHETGFLHIKEIKTFGYRIVIEEESEKISKFSKIKYWSPRNFDGKDYSSILGDAGTVSRVDKMFVVKVFCIPNQFQKRLNCLLLIVQKKFFWPISEEKLPGDSRVSLHDVVFVVDRHRCVARSTGKVSPGKFQNKMLTTRKIYNLKHGYKKQTLSDEFLGWIFPRYRKFLFLIRCAMHHFHLSLSISTP